MSIKTTLAAETKEAAMLAALAAVLKLGAFVTDDIAALRAVECDTGAEDGARSFARRSINWLISQQSSTMIAQSWCKDADARQ